MSKDIIIVNHTHWDREWYFSDQDSLVLSSMLFTNAIKELKEHPEASFVLDGQTSILTDYLSIMPSMIEDVKKLVTNGQLQIGPWYTQPDALHVQGESLLRNGMIGHLEASRFGQNMDIGYLPDTFGFNAQIPVILNQLGLNKFLFWRGIDPQKTGGFYFNWQGLGGASKVVAASMPQGYSTGMMLAPTTDYVDNRLDKAIDFIVENNSKPLANVLIPSGNDQMNIVLSIADKVKEINKMGRNHYEIGTYQDFFAKLHDSDLPSYSGELIEPVYARVHRTCGSSRMDTKLAATRLEQTLIHEVEPIMVIAKRCGVDMDNGVLIAAWKKLLESQAHDSMAGSVVDSVNDDILQRLKQGQEIADGIINTIQKMLSLKLNLSAEQVLVLNPLPKLRAATFKIKILTHSQYVTFNEVSDQILISQEYIEPRENILRQTPSGNEYITESGYYESYYQLTCELPSLGYSVLTFKESAELPADSAMAETRLGHHDWYLQVENGQLDLHWRNHCIPAAIQLVDDGNAGDTYDFSPLKDDVARSISWTSYQFSKDNSHQKLILKATAQLPKDLEERTNRPASGNLPVEMVLTTDKSGMLSIDLKIDNTILDHRMRLKIATELETKINQASVPFGHITRQNQVLTAEWQQKYAEMPVNIWPLDQHVSVTDGDNQVTVFTEDVKEYAQDHGILYFTLMATTDQLGKPNLIYRPGRASGDTTNEGHVMIPTPKAELFNQTLNYHFDVLIGAKCTEQQVAEVQEELLFRPISYQRQNLNLFLNRLDNKLQDSLVSPTEMPLKFSAYSELSVGTISACYPAYFTKNAFVIRIQNTTAHEVTWPIKAGQTVVNAIEEPIQYNGKIPAYDAITILIH